MLNDTIYYCKSLKMESVFTDHQQMDTDDTMYASMHDLSKAHVFKVKDQRKVKQA